MTIYPVWIYTVSASGDLTFKSNTEAVEVQLMSPEAPEKTSGRVIAANQQATEIITAMLLILF